MSTLVSTSRLDPATSALQAEAKSAAIAYVLLSPTFGMHQYTADLANRLANGESSMSDRLSAIDCPEVVLVTTTTVPRDRYSPAVRIETPVTSHATGFSAEGLDVAGYRRVLSTISFQLSALSHQPSTISHEPRWVPGQSSAMNPVGFRGSHNSPAIVHFTGVHLWNLPLVYALRRRGAPVVHTLHDLAPHSGVRYGGLIRLWNRLIIGSGCHLLVHGQRYREQLLATGVPAGRVTYSPLLMGFLDAGHPWPPLKARSGVREASVLFFGRVEAYKGVDTLLEAWRRLGVGEARLIVAGQVGRDVALPPLPPGVELRDRRVMDDEGDMLFRGADLVVLPYRDATQSALVAAAYAYGVPVVVTAAGALPEYVVEGETGWVVPPGDPAALAATLRQALADPARLARMGVAGRAWFEARRGEEEAILANIYRVDRDIF